MKKSLKFVVYVLTFMACIEPCLLVAHAGNGASFFGYRGDTPSLPPAEEQFPEIFEQGNNENDNDENNINFIPQLDPDTKHQPVNSEAQKTQVPRRVGIVQIVFARRVVRQRELQLRIDQAAQQVWNDDFKEEKEPKASFFTKALCFLHLQTLKVPKLPSEKAKKARVFFEAVLPVDLRMIILSYVDSAGELSTLSSLYQAEPEVKSLQDKIRLLRDYQLRKLRPFFPEFVKVPAVTQADLDHLHGELKKRWSEGGEDAWKKYTSIHQPMPQFGVGQFKNCVGLCKVVTGFHPDLSMIGDLSDAREAEIIQEWNENPFLPMFYLNVFEEDVIAKMLRKMTGRKTLSMTSPARNEASRRGRNKDGQIETATYHFGEGDIKELQRHAILSDLSDGGLWYPHAYGVNEVPEGRTIEEFTNSLGLVHCIGLASERSPIRDKNGKIVGAEIRGGAFELGVWLAGSSHASQRCSGDRLNLITSRLAEDDVP